MSVITQGIIIVILEILVLFFGFYQLKRKDGDGVAQFCGLYVIIAMSLVILIEIGLTISWIVCK